MRTINLFILGLLILSLVGCADRDNEKKQKNMKVNISFASIVTEEGFIVDSMDQIPYGIGKFHVVVDFFDLLPDVYIFGLRISDGVGNVIDERRGGIDADSDKEALKALGIFSEGDSIVTLTLPQARFGMVFKDITIEEGIHQPGFWKVEVFRNDDRVETMIEVVKQLAEQELPTGTSDSGSE